MAQVATLDPKFSLVPCHIGKQPLEHEVSVWNRSEIQLGAVDGDTSLERVLDVLGRHLSTLEVDSSDTQSLEKKLVTAVNIANVLSKGSSHNQKIYNNVAITIFHVLLAIVTLGMFSLRKQYLLDIPKYDLALLLNRSDLTHLENTEFIQKVLAKLSLKEFFLLDKQQKSAFINNLHNDAKPYWTKLENMGIIAQMENLHPDVQGSLSLAELFTATEDSDTAVYDLLMKTDREIASMPIETIFELKSTEMKLLSARLEQTEKKEHKEKGISWEKKPLSAISFLDKEEITAFFKEMNANKTRISLKGIELGKELDQLEDDGIDGEKEALNERKAAISVELQAIQRHLHAISRPYGLHEIFPKERVFEAIFDYFIRNSHVDNHFVFKDRTDQFFEEFLDFFASHPFSNISLSNKPKAEPVDLAPETPPRLVASRTLLQKLAGAPETPPRGVPASPTPFSAKQTFVEDVINKRIHKIAEIFDIKLNVEISLLIERVFKKYDQTNIENLLKLFVKLDVPVFFQCLTKDVLEKCNWQNFSSKEIEAIFWDYGFNRFGDLSVEAKRAILNALSQRSSGDRFFPAEFFSDEDWREFPFEDLTPDAVKMLLIPSNKSVKGEALQAIKAYHAHHINLIPEDKFKALNQRGLIPNWLGELRKPSIG